VLKSRGIGVIGAATVSDAIDLIQQKDLSPDLALCDYNLPGATNGAEGIGLLRAALGRELPAIVMTGDTRSQTIESVASQGLSVLIKPFLAEELVQLINKLHQTSASTGANRNSPVLGRQLPAS
jgi:CheY-like chemotaxis protein